VGDIIRVKIGASTRTGVEVAGITDDFITVKCFARDYQLTPKQIAGAVVEKEARR
jgi:hypothetical protein